MGKTVIVMMQKHNGPNNYLAKYNFFPLLFCILFLEWNMSWTMFLWFLCLPPSSLWFCVCSFWMTLTWEEKEEAVLCSCRWLCRDGSSKRSLVRRLSNQKRSPQILNRWAQTALELKWRVGETSLNVQRHKLANILKCGHISSCSAKFHWPNSYSKVPGVQVGNIKKSQTKMC